VAYKVIRHYEGFSNDPFVYGARVYNVDYCTCVDLSGKLFNFNQSVVWRTVHYKVPEFNFTLKDG